LTTPLVTLLEIILGFDRAQAVKDLVCCVKQAVAFGPDALQVAPLRSVIFTIAWLYRSGNLSFVFHVLGPFV
jgi:hypothetical protein